MGEPLISVIMPCYNHEKYVEQSIQSVMDQPFQNIELIVIDDGSRDKTPEIIRKLADRYGFYYELQEVNKGICHTLNKAISHARGRYIKFLASDDFLHDQSIQEFVNHMENNPRIDACFGDLVEVDKDGNYVRLLKSGVSKLFQNRFQVNSIVNVSADMAIQVSPMVGTAYIIKKSVLGEFGKFDETQIVEDWDLFLFLVCHSKKISYIPSIAGYWRRIELKDRTVRRDNRRWFLSDFRIITKYKHYVSRRSFEIAIKNIIRFHTSIAVTCNESPAYLLSVSRKYLFIWSLFTDYSFVSRVFGFYREKFLKKLHLKLSR